MAHHVSGPNITLTWHTLLLALLEDGVEVSPRGFKTKEILNTTIVVQNGLRNIIVNPTRDLNYRFMIAEWLWIQAGLNDVEILARYNSIMRQFSDDGHILSGAYGPRLMPQMSYIIESLRNPDTRQAVATIWTPSPEKSKDIPCTISLQWLVRDEKLHCTINMRSSDAWLGIPYDYFTFSQLTNLVASIVHLPVGSITMNLASSHLYEIHWIIAEAAVIDLNAGVLESPTIPRSDVTSLPTATDLERMLQGKIVGLEWPWHKYYEVLLSPNKSAALEVLREFSLNKG